MIALRGGVRLGCAACICSFALWSMCDFFLLGGRPPPLPIQYDSKTGAVTLALGCFTQTQTQTQPSETREAQWSRSSLHDSQGTLKLGVGIGTVGNSYYYLGRY